MAAALQIWSATFTRAFDALPASVRENIRQKVDEMGTRLGSFPHKRLAGRPEFKLRVGDYRVLYEFNVERGRLLLHYVGNRREIYKRS